MVTTANIIFTDGERKTFDINGIFFGYQVMLEMPVMNYIWKDKRQHYIHILRLWLATSVTCIMLYCNVAMCFVTQHVKSNRLLRSYKLNASGVTSREMISTLKFYFNILGKPVTRVPSVMTSVCDLIANSMISLRFDGNQIDLLFLQ